ncbi:adenylyltransferase/cytidyltransferase family protein, partial [Candidatus Pelagibacter sp.]|nr:adenylyltransferase/cytidyltransferase family protein [Candidatus Pelagibacter sp.]
MNLELSEVQKKIQNLKKNKKKIVLCHGVFDLVHLGHLEHFKTAKRFGDYLVVSLTKDKFIQKGPGRPIFNEQQRMEYLRHIKVIDQVVISKTESSIDTINLIKPNFYVKGPDYKDSYKDKTKKIILEKKAVEKIGGKIKFTNDITFS